MNKLTGQDESRYTTVDDVEIAMKALRMKYVSKAIWSTVVGILTICVGLILVAPGILFALMYIIWMNTIRNRYRDEKNLLLGRKRQILEFARTGSLHC